MQKYHWIGLTALALSLSLLVLMLSPGCIKKTNQEGAVRLDDNTILLGTQAGDYHFSTTCQMQDGVIMIASVLSPRSGKQDLVSVIKLSANGEFIGEQIFPLHKESILSLLKQKGKGQSLRTHQISHHQNHFYVLLTAQAKQTEIPYILKLDQNGSLLETLKVDLELESGTSIKTCVNAEILYLSYLNNREKMLCVSKIDLLSARVLQTSVRFFRHKNLSINAVAANPADSIFSVVAYDKELGCSFFQYTPQTDLKEMFRTQPATDITALKYFENKLYGAVKEDSLLEVIDLTELGKPLIRVTDIPSAKDFRLVDLVLDKAGFHLLAKSYNLVDEKKSFMAEIISYNPDGSSAAEKSFPINESDTLRQIIDDNGTPVFILGEGSDYMESKASRIFIKSLQS